MKSGIPAMSIPPMDPLRLNEIKVEPNIANEKFTIHLNNIEVKGLSDLEVQDLRPRLNSLKVRLALLFPKLISTCLFNVNGSIYKLIDVRGEGQARLEYNNVLVRAQLDLAYENRTFKIISSDSPMIDFNTAKIVLTDENKEGLETESTKQVTASELGPLLFWVLADHIVQDIDEYLLKYFNNNLLLFKVPETFKPAITWLMNRSGFVNGGSNNNEGPSGFGFTSIHNVPLLNPFPFLNQWINSIHSGFSRPFHHPIIKNHHHHHGQHGPRISHQSDSNENRKFSP